jgi:hypothetical protein
MASSKEADPLRWWRFAVPRLKQAFALFSQPKPIQELYCRGPNKTGKTESIAAWVLACMQKREHLDGVPLPQWKGRIEALCLVLDYKQQLLSVQPAYLRLLGRWPHKARYVGEILTSLRVRPVNGTADERTWSVIHFLSEENRKTGTGARADIVHFDEPPRIEILRELRKAGHAGRKSVRIIGATPTVRQQWAPILADYGDTPRNSLRQVDRLRAEVRWSLWEVATWLLSQEAKQDMVEAYKGDVLFGDDGGARIFGDYMNTDGACPLDAQVLLWMLTLCKEPDLEEWRVTIEASQDGQPSTVAKVPVQVWRRPSGVKKAYIDIDPASGVDDGAHNPAGIHCSEEGTGDLLARWNGYLAPYSVGVLGAGMARQYHNAPVDIEMKDHWGVNVVRGCQASRYGNLCYEQRELRPGVWSKEVGFDQNEETKAVIIGQIQEWLASWRAAAKFNEDGDFMGFDLSKTYAKCPSREVIESMLDTRLDERGKIIAGPGVAHGEDVILWGQKLRRAVSKLNREIPELQEAIQTSEQRAVALIQGKIRSNGEDREERYDRVFEERPRL